MSTLDIIVNGVGRLLFSEKGTSIQDIIDFVDSYFAEIPYAARHERIVVQGPSATDPEGFLVVGPRETTLFLTAKECKLPAYRSLAQIIESATTKSHDLTTMGLVVPYGSPNELTIYMKD